ncbi:MAG: PhnA domain-containing protein [Marinosulfonomonas sp.]|nr:PhnA domain-containing protein [Marinosulfonomonas sp.]
MTTEETLAARSGDTCELCAATDALGPFDVGPDADGTPATSALLCQTCRTQIEAEPEPNHWRALSSSMWSEHAPVQVLAWRMLDRLKDHDWAQSLLEMLYLDDATMAWAQAGVAEDTVIHRDANGAQLAAGDTVVLIKDLPVKGAGFTAKRGTAVRGISLVADNAGHIEGRVEGQRIVILTAFVKKK